MSFKKGDQVQVLDDVISGTVKKVAGIAVIIETEDGFEMTFEAHELIPDKNSRKLNPFFSDDDVSSVIASKEDKAKRKTVKKKPKDKYMPTMEVDLHIHQLVKSTKGMTNYDMLTLQLDTARRQLDFAIGKRIQKMVFIHGVGEGVLKEELDTFLRRYNNVTFYDADYQKYGLGATEVYIYQNVNPND